MRNSTGSTLIEMIVYASVLVFVMGVAISFVLWILRAQESIRATRQVTESVRTALVVMGNEMREATSIYTPTTTSTQISFETTKSLPTQETSTYVDFFLCGSQLCMKRESQNPAVLTPENITIQNLVFEEVRTGSVPSVQAVFDAAYVNPKNRPELDVTIHIQTTFSSRAY
jgi:type II secretory pathway pseudopilin PulG